MEITMEGDIIKCHPENQEESRILDEICDCENGIISTDPGWKYDDGGFKQTKDNKLIFFFRLRK